MTNKGAIDILRIILREATECEDSISYVTDIGAEPLRLAIKALEKQIPKKPIELNCPRCRFNGINNSLWVFTYCPECGQAIDWSED